MNITLDQAIQLLDRAGAIEMNGFMSFYHITRSPNEQTEELGIPFLELHWIGRPPISFHARDNASIKVEEHVMILKRRSNETEERIRLYVAWNIEHHLT